MTALVPFSFEVVPAAKEVAADVCATEFVPKSYRGRREAVLAAILTGQEVGVGPMQAIAGFDVIDGSAKMKPELARALVLAAGHELWYEVHSATKVVVCGRRAGSEKVTNVEWTLDDAKRAGLGGKQNWQRYPRQMLVARATGELCSLIFGDVVKGFSSGGDADIIEDTQADSQDQTQVVTQVGSTEPVARRRRKTTPAPVAETPLEPLPEDIEDAEVIEPRAHLVVNGESNLSVDTSTGEIIDAATNTQLRAIAAMCVTLGWGDDQRRQYAGFMVGRPIKSAKELSKTEASTIIDGLQQELADRQVAPDAAADAGAGSDGEAPSASPSEGDLADQAEMEF